MFVFGPFQFDPAERILLRAGVPVRLTHKAAELLLALLESDGKVLTKEFLIQRVWPSTFVADGSLTFQMNRLRQALDDSAEAPTYIATIPKRGYRLVCAVTRQEEAGQEILPNASTTASAETAPLGRAVESPPPSLVDEPVHPANVASMRRGLRPVLTTVAILILVLGAIATALGLRDPTLLEVTDVIRLTYDGKSKSRLVALDSTRLLVTVGERQRLFRLDQGTYADNPLESYIVHDVSSIRGEVLATRRDDRGAEHGLWAVGFDGTGARRIGMVKTKDNASWSHDGRRIAYVHEHNLNVTDAFGVEMQSLATFTGLIGSPIWTPNDRSIRVSVSNPSDRTVTQRIYEVNVSKSEPPSMVQGPPDRWNCCGVWMPGSREYVFESSTEKIHELWMLIDRWNSLRRQVELRTLMPRGARKYLSLTPSHDGRRVYAIGVPKPGLSVYDERSRAFTPYLGGIPAFAVRFSPDRQWVAYIDITDYTLWRARADGSDRRQLTSSVWSVDAVAWNPDSLRLAIRAQAPGQKYKKIHVLSANGGAPVPLDPRDIEQGSPTWSPDGNRIAFGDVPETHGDATGSERIQIFDLATRQMSELAGSQGLWSSRWSPDGRYLAATRIADRALMLYTFATSRWRELKPTRVDDLVWTTDSLYLYCNPEGPRWALRVRVSDGHVEPFLNVSGESIHTSASLALDGRPLFLRDTADVYALELARR